MFLNYLEMKFYYLLLFLVLLSCEKSNSNSNSLGSTAAKFELSSPAFSNNGVIPDKYSCKSSSQVSIPINWKNAPQGTLSFVLLMEDSDAIAVAGKVWTHWLLYNIPSNVNAIDEGKSKEGPWPANTLVGINSFQEINYLGPCPPSGRKHTYIFRLFALNIADIGVGNGAFKEQVLNAIYGAVLDSATYKGVYTQ